MVIFHLSFFIGLSVAYVMLAFVVERGSMGVVFEDGRGAGKKLVGRRRGRDFILASL